MTHQVNLWHIKVPNGGAERSAEVFDRRLAAEGAIAKVNDLDAFGPQPRLQFTEILSRAEIVALTNEMVAVHQHDGWPLREGAADCKDYEDE